MDRTIAKLSEASTKIQGACGCDAGNATVAAAILLVTGHISADFESTPPLAFEETDRPAPAKTPQEPENSGGPPAAV